MPIIKSAIKRMRQTAKRRARNITVKRELKGALKAFFSQPSAETLRAAQGEIDTAVKKNILNKNTASRRKARIARIAKEAGVQPAGEKKAPKSVTKAKAAPKKTTKEAAAKAPKPTAPKKTTATKTKKTTKSK